MNRILIAATLAVSTLLSACGETLQDQCANAKNPTECVQVGQVPDAAGYLLAVLGGVGAALIGLAILAWVIDSTD